MDANLAAVQEEKQSKSILTQTLKPPNAEEAQKIWAFCMFRFMVQVYFMV